MVIVTGAAGFIGSCMVQHLNEAGIEHIVCVDEFSRADKNRNLSGKKYKHLVHRDGFLAWFAYNATQIEAIFHLGARTDTTEQDRVIFEKLNVAYTKAIWEICTQHAIPLLYASSAATYGGGEMGYKDSHDVPTQLKPLNPYGDSKNDFDIWALAQKQQPKDWFGFKFFNVYGPNEYHKSRMASVIFHTVQQIRKTGAMKLFRSHRPDFKNGEQSRDFIYVKDVCAMLFWFFLKKPKNGLYNVGTGQARTFYDLAKNTFLALDLEPKISFIDTPKDIRNTYQYFTEADMEKVRSVGYAAECTSLEVGIRDYVQRYLKDDKLY